MGLGNPAASQSLCVSTRPVEGASTFTGNAISHPRILPDSSASARLGLPPRNRRFREPHGQAAALAQGAVIGGPIRHSVALLRDVMTATIP